MGVQIVKFQRKLFDFQYVLSFDLAKHQTGYSLVNIFNKEIVDCGLIICDSDNPDIWLDMEEKISNVIAGVIERFGIENFFVVKEAMPKQAGRFTTISTLSALAQSHAILSFACSKLDVNIYDLIGVAAVSEKAVFKQLIGIEKPEKKDIFESVMKMYGIQDSLKSVLNYDITDSVAVVETLISKKWNSDIQQEVKELKKMQKKYKTEKKQMEIENKISGLLNLSI